MVLTAADFNTRTVTIKRRKLSRPFASFEDLPSEIHQLILDFCGQLDYYKYRLLRCHPSLRYLIDKEYLVLGQKVTEFLLPGKDSRESLEWMFLNFNQFEEKIELFASKNKIPLSRIKLFCEFYNRDNGYSRTLLIEIMTFLNDHEVAYVLFPKHNLNRHNFHNHPASKKGVVLIDFTHDIHVSDLSTFKNVNFRVFDICEELELYSGNQHMDSLIDAENYVFRSNLTHLKSLKLEDLKKFPLQITNKIVLNSLEHLEIVEIGKSGKLLSINNFNFPKLQTLRVISSKLSKLSKNNLPSLYLLVIEETANREDISLEMNKNNLPKLKKLNISTHFMKQMFQNKLSCNDESYTRKPLMEYCRIDTSLSNMVGALGDIPDILSNVKELTISVRADPTMTTMLLKNIHNPSRLKKLTLIDSTLITLDPLTKIDFKNLTQFHIYNTNDSLLSLPFLKMPKLKDLFIIESLITTVNIRGYPLLKQITFLTEKKNVNETNKLRYFHFCGSDLNNGEEETEVRFKSSQAEWIDKYSTTITREARNVGIVKLNYCSKKLKRQERPLSFYSFGGRFIF